MSSSSQEDLMIEGLMLTIFNPFKDPPSPER
jgi:hypothetical protein